MGSAVGFRTISLTIKHAWGESFITQRNKANPALPTCFTIAWKKPVSLATKLALSVKGMGKEEVAGREGEWRHDSPR